MNVEDLKMPNGSSFIDYLKGSFPNEETVGWTEWTRGHLACQRRLAEILLPQIEAHKPTRTKP